MIKVSVIIPSYNEEKDIRKCLSSLQEQLFRDFEIIVVDDGSTDSTKKIVKSFKDVRLIEGKYKGPGFSRNLGAKKAKGEILVFVDSDMEFDKNYLKKLIEPLIKNKEIIGTTHETEIVKNTENIWSKCWGGIRVSKENAHKVKIFRSIIKNKFLEFGGFDPKYGYADDQTLWFKYKLKPIVAKNTICYHKNPDNLKEVYKQSRWIGSSIDLGIFNLSILKYLILLSLMLVSPLAIPLLSLKKAHSIRNFKVLFPWMIIFMAFRYSGSLEGIFRQIYLKVNMR